MTFLVIAVATLLPSDTKADFGDYVDPTFNCPAKTTCDQVCVATLSECPIAMLCNGTETLCEDGSCADTCREGLVTPCEYECASVACAKVVDYFDACKELYAPLYDFEAACGEIEVATEALLYDWTEPVFVFVYCWFSSTAFLLLAWCAYNQRFSPVPGSNQTLQVDSTTPTENDDLKNPSLSFQTGYKIHPVGVFINILTGLTILGIHFLLGYLTIQYYIQQEAITIFDGKFDDEVQVLLAFEIVWSKFLCRFLL
jgi:hypothetical protein